MKRSEFHFEGVDGLPLFAQAWLPERPPAAILGIVHGFGEHSGRYDTVVAEMLAHRIGVIGFDLRGHWRSPGQRGHILSWREYHCDVQAFLTWIRGQEFGGSTFLLGHSLGALIVAEFILSQPKKLSGVVLSGLAVDPVGAAKPVLVAMAKLLSRIWPTFPMKLGLDANALSRDRGAVQAYKTDPLVHGMTSARWEGRNPWGHRTDQGQREPGQLAIAHASRRRRQDQFRRRRTRILQERSARYRRIPVLCGQLP